MEDAPLLSNNQELVRRTDHVPAPRSSDGAASRRYDVLWPMLNVDRRVTFIIDPQGRVEHIIRHEVRVYRHLDDVLAFLKAHPLPASP